MLTRFTPASSRGAIDASAQAATRATGLVALAACGFAAIPIFTTLATNVGAGLVGILAWRYLIATLALGLAAHRGRVLRFDGHAWRVMLVAGTLQSLIAMLSLSALRYISAGTASFLFFTFPAWVAIIARVRHSEPLTTQRLIALALSLGGVFVMIGLPGSAALQPNGVILALVSALIYAMYIPMIAGFQRTVSPLAMALYISAGAAILLSGAAAVRGELWLPWSGTTAGVVLGISLLSTAGSFMLFLRGLQVLGPVRTAIVGTVEPFATALMGAWVLGQPLGWGTMAGGVFIAAAVVLLQLRFRRRDAGR